MLTFLGVPAADQRTHVTFSVSLLRAQLLPSAGNMGVPLKILSSKCTEPVGGTGT